MVEDDRVVEKVIKFFKEKKFGRLMFLLFNKIKLCFMREKLKFGILVMDVVFYDLCFRNVVVYVFGDIFIVNDMDEVREVGIGKVRMVIFGGEFFEWSGVIIGGYYKLRGKFGVNVDEIRKRVEVFEGRKEVLEV